MASFKNDTVKPEQANNPSDAQQAQIASLLGVGSQFASPKSSITSTWNQTPTVTLKNHGVKTGTCPYHGLVLQVCSGAGSQGAGLGPMDRYLAEGPAQQYSVFHRSDNGQLSTAKGCTCNEAPKKQSRI